MAQSWTCSHCGVLPACSFCTCSRPEIFLCQSCLSPHFEKYPGRFHPNLPLQAFGHHRTVGYFERLNPRLEALERGKNRLQDDIRDVQLCIEEFTAKLNELISEIWKHGEARIAEMWRVKEEMERMITEAVEEVARTIYEENPKISSDLAYQLRSTAELAKIFRYEITVQQSPPINLTYTFPCIVTRSLPQIFKNSVKQFNLRTGEAVSTTIDQTFTELTVFCPVTSDTVLCIGGHPSISDVFELSLYTGKLRAQQALNEGRGLPGVLKHSESVYLFGGIGGDSYENLNSCEKLTMVDGPWVRLGDMKQAKSCFSPCEFAGNVYLPVPNQSFEVFEIATESFAELPVLFDIPGFEPKRDGLVSFLIDGEIIAVTGKEKIGRWRVGEESSFRVSEGVMNNSGSAVSNVAPVRYGNEVFWVNYWTGAIVKFDVGRFEIMD